MGFREGARFLCSLCPNQTKATKFSFTQNKNTKKSIIMEFIIVGVQTVFGATIGAAIGIVTQAVSQGIASMALPTIMSTTGTVISGVGTIHGSITASVASFAVTPISITFIVFNAIVGAVYYIVQVPYVREACIGVLAILFP